MLQKMRTVIKDKSCMYKWIQDPRVFDLACLGRGQTSKIRIDEGIKSLIPEKLADPENPVHIRFVEAISRSDGAVVIIDWWSGLVAMVTRGDRKEDRNGPLTWHISHGTTMVKLPICGILLKKIYFGAGHCPASLDLKICRIKPDKLVIYNG